MAEFRVERGERREPLAVLPRYRKDENGLPITPTVVLDIEFARGVAGCAICSKPIPKDTSRIKVNVKLDQPIVSEKGRARTHEAFYFHPGCLTDRIKPEIIRHGFDCYDCGAIPDEGLRWGNYCFTVSRFSPAPLCSTCVKKPKWSCCQVCHIWYPPWMLQTVDDPRAKEEPPPTSTPIGMSVTTGGVTMRPAASMSFAPIDDFAIPPVDVTCEHCARRHDIRTVEKIESEAEKFERLRREIAERGFLEAGYDD